MARKYTEYAEPLFLCALIILAIALTYRGVPWPIPKVCTLDAMRHVRDGYVAFDARRGDEPIVTRIKSKGNKRVISFWIEEPDANTRLIVQTRAGRFMPPSLAKGDKVVYMEGILVSQPKRQFFRLVGMPVYSQKRQNDISDVPRRKSIL